MYFFPIPIPPKFHPHELLEGVRSPSEALALEQRAAGYGRKAKSSLLSVLVNKVLLAHLFIDILSSVASELQWHS